MSSTCCKKATATIYSPSENIAKTKLINDTCKSSLGQTVCNTSGLETTESHFNRHNLLDIDRHWNTPNNIIYLATKTKCQLREPHCP